MKRQIPFLPLLFFGTVLSAAELAPAEKKDFIPVRGGTLTVSGDALSTRGRCYVQSAKTLEVSPERKYHLSGEFRTADGDALTIYFGLIPFDAKGRIIGPANTIITPNSEAVLTAPAKKGSRSVSLKPLKDKRNYTFHRHKFLAFNADHSGKLADLPNFDVAGPFAKVTLNPDGTFTVELKQALKSDYAQGTPVRVHMTGGTFLTVAGEKEELKITPRWQKFEGTTIPGVTHSHTRKQFRTGTKSVRIYFSGFPAAGKEASKNIRLEFRNIKLREVR